MADIERMNKRLARERAARKEAERLLETKSLELFTANENLTQARDELEARVIERTQALQKSEELFRNFIEAASDIIYQITPDGFFTYANPVAIHKLGLTDEADVIGLHFLDLVHHEDRERLTTFYTKQLLEGEKNTYLEFRLKTPSIEDVWIGQNVQMVTSENEVIGLQAVARDISDRKKVERELGQQRDFAQQILSSMGQGLTLTDSNFKFMYANPAYAKILGCSAGSLIGKKPYDFIHPEDRAKVIEVHRQTKLDGASFYEVEARLISFDGRIVPVLATGTMRTNEDDKTSNIAVVTDLTVRKQMEETLRNARDQALDASRMKSEFLANMSHEIRTPLNGIIGMADLLQESELDEEQEEFVEIINTSGTALLSIINDILDFSKITEGKIELEYQPFPLRETIEEALDLLASKAAEKGLELACMMSHHLPTHIIGDVVRVRQVLINLLSNAVKFTQQGEVVVSVGQQKCEDGREQLHISVSDTGIGIPEDARNKLFQSFSQVDASTTRKYGGSGLGLAISKELCELMGGKMWVESTFGKGSTFYFTIDLAVAANHKAVESSQSTAELEGKRLLIVDDNETNRKILIHQTKLWGMVPEAASSGAEALQWLNENRAYDLAILDMQMPHMDGCMLATEIRNLSGYSDIPLIMLSSIGLKLPAAHQGLFSAQASKPVKVGVLRQVVEKVCAEHDPVEIKRKPIKKIKNDYPSNSPVRILLTEDNYANQKVALGSLRHLGYSADLAKNGREAVEAVKRRHYDVILMDIQMPEMNGIEATQHIRKNCAESEQPFIVAMTANAVKGDKERFLAAGMDKYLSKPFRLNELAEILQPLMEKIEAK